MTDRPAYDDHGAARRFERVPEGADGYDGAVLDLYDAFRGIGVAVAPAALRNAPEVRRNWLEVA